MAAHVGVALVPINCPSVDAGSRPSHPTKEPLPRELRIDSYFPPRRNIRDLREGRRLRLRRTGGCQLPDQRLLDLKQGREPQFEFEVLLAQFGELSAAIRDPVERRMEVRQRTGVQCR